MRKWVHQVQRVVRVLVRGKEIARIQDPELFDAIEQGRWLKRRYDEMRLQLDGMREVIRQKAALWAGEHTVLHLRAGRAAVRVTFKDSVVIPEVHLEEVRKIVQEAGVPFEQAVKVRATYRPTERLLEVLERAGRLDLLEIKTHKPTVEFYEAGEEGF